MSPRPPPVTLPAPPPSPGSGPPTPAPVGWAGRPLSQLMPRAFAVCMKFTGLAAQHEHALAAQYRSILRTCFEGQLGMQPGFEVALDHCIGVCMDARQVTRSMALDLAKRLQAVGGGQIWIQMPSGEILSSSGAMLPHDSTAQKYTAQSCLLADDSQHVSRRACVVEQHPLHAWTLSHFTHHKQCNDYICAVKPK